MTSLSRYTPHSGHARCPIFGAPQWAHAEVRGALTRQLALRRRVRERDIFFFGTAMGFSGSGF